MQLSIVTTMYLSAPYLEDFYSRISTTANNITEDYEIIFVNDGSPDNSLGVAKAFYEKDRRVRVIDLSRNFGHHKAIMTGLAHARGKLVFLIDCDLEEEPELLGKLYAEFKKSNADVIYGVQQTRKGDLFERINGKVFWSFFNMLSHYPVHKDQTVARLMSARYIASLLEHRDREVFLGGLLAITGFKQVPIIVKKNSKGSSTYNLRKKISFLFTSITSFSNKPLVYIFYLGLIISGVSIISALCLVFLKLIYHDMLIGWPSLIVSLWLLGGVIIFCLGIIGIYLSRIFMETKQRPNTIIRKIYERNDSN